MTTLSQRLSVLGASTALAGAAVFGGVSMTPLASASLAPSVHQDYTLTAEILFPPDSDYSIIPSFAQSLKFLMDALLKIGPLTLPGVIDPDNNVTLQSLLTPSNLQLDGATPSTMTDLFDQLGLDNIQLSTVLGLLGVAPTDTFGDLLGPGGELAGLGGVTLNTLLGGAGASDATTIDGLVGLLGMDQTPIVTLVGQLLPGGVTTMGGLFEQLGIAGLQGFLPIMGSSTTQSIADFLAMIGFGPTITLGGLLGSGGMLEAVGDMSLGQLLGFDDTTTLGGVLTGMVSNIANPDYNPADPLGPTNMPFLSLGELSVTQLLGEVQLNPTDSLSEVLSQLPLGLNDAPLGDTTLAEFLGLMAPGTTIDSTTTITGFLDGAGMGTLTLDDWLGLGGVDISNWFA